MQSLNGVTYKLDLPSHVQIHNAFHISLLKRFVPDARFGRGVPLSHAGSANPFDPEVVLKHRFGKRGPQFYVKWRNRPMIDCTWVEEVVMLDQAKPLLVEY